MTNPALRNELIRETQGVNSIEGLAHYLVSPAAADGLTGQGTHLGAWEIQPSIYARAVAIAEEWNKGDYRSATRDAKSLAGYLNKVGGSDINLGFEDDSPVPGEPADYNSQLAYYLGQQLTTGGRSGR